MAIDRKLTFQFDGDWWISNGWAAFRWEERPLDGYREIAEAAQSLRLQITGQGDPVSKRDATFHEDSRGNLYACFQRPGGQIRIPALALVLSPYEECTMFGKRVLCIGQPRLSIIVAARFVDGEQLLYVNPSSTPTLKDLMDRIACAANGYYMASPKRLKELWVAASHRASRAEKHLMEAEAENSEAERELMDLRRFLLDKKDPAYEELALW